MKRKHKNQRELETTKDIRKAIENANSVYALNRLRQAIAQNLTPELLEKWQTKYWRTKKLEKIKRISKGL